VKLKEGSQGINIHSLKSFTQNAGNQHESAQDNIRCTAETKREGEGDGKLGHIEIIVARGDTSAGMCRDAHVA
jgi:hypothetical protein